MINKFNYALCYFCKKCGCVYSDSSPPHKCACGYKLKKRTDTIYYCSVTGVAGSYSEVNSFVWNFNKDRYINELLLQIDDFIKIIAYKFVFRYKLRTDVKDIEQYLRTSVFTLLRDSYNPGRGKAEHFAKASCNIFLRRYLQEYYYKHNSVHNTPFLLSSLKGSDVDFYSYTMEGDEDQLLVISDYNVEDPVSKLTANAYKSIFYDLLNNLEKQIYEYMVDEDYSFTQTEIAMSLGISQPMVSYKVKVIRNKIKEFLDSEL